MYTYMHAHAPTPTHYFGEAQNVHVNFHYLLATTVITHSEIRLTTLNGAPHLDFCIIGGGNAKSVRCDVSQDAGL